MKKLKKPNDELKAEYNLESLSVRKVGPLRKGQKKNVIQLDSDVAEVFPDTTSVNEALRFLIRITREKSSSYSTT